MRGLVKCDGCGAVVEPARIGNDDDCKNVTIGEHSFDACRSCRLKMAVSLTGLEHFAAGRLFDVDGGTVRNERRALDRRLNPPVEPPATVLDPPF